MRRFTSALALGLGLWSLPIQAQELKIDKHVLSNGLTVYTHEDHSAPLMSFYILYDVGSTNEHLGITGISHLFEHMMFNGSSKYAPKEFDFNEAAGGNSNGYTVRDYTAYMETFPPEAIDLVLDLESDRMASMRIEPSNLEQERGIVKEERRLRTDNDNVGKLDELLYLQAFVAHPYRYPVVGFMNDLNNIKLEDTRRYFDTYYTPNNAIVAVVGDFKTAELMPKLKAAFEKVKRGPVVPPVYAFEPEQTGERRATLVQEAELPMLMVGWRVPGADNLNDMVAIDVALALLSVGDSSRLYQGLVVDKAVAVQVQSWYETLSGPSLATAILQVAPDKSAAEAEAALHAEVERLAQQPISEAELRKARNQLRASTVRQLKTVDGRGNAIATHALMYGDPQQLVKLMDARDKVTVADVQRVLRQYFVQDKRTVITLIPAETKPTEAKPTETKPTEAKPTETKPTAPTAGGQ